MTYTFQPLPEAQPETFPFWLFLFLCFIAFIVIKSISEESEWSCQFWHWIFAIIVAYPLTTLYGNCTKPVPQPKNIQVIAKLVSTQGEMVVNNSGKTGYSYTPSLLVQYSVPEGVITLIGSYNVVYPKEAILYAN
jgi:hypothetical protein